jgi:hypothetical protein
MGPLPLFVVMTYSGSRTSWYREFPAMPACSYVRFGSVCLVPASQASGATPSEAWNLHVRKICSLLLSGEKNLRRKFASLCRKDQARRSLSVYSCAIVTRDAIGPIWSGSQPRSRSRLYETTTHGGWGCLRSR